MKIVQIVTQMEGGGAQRVAALFGEHLGERRHVHELWFLYRKRAAYDNRPFVRVLSASAAPGVIEYLAIAVKLYRMLSRVRPDAVIAHTHYSNVLSLLVGFLARIPRRMAVQHNPVQTYPRAARWADRLFGTVGIYTSNIVVSGAVLDSIARYPKSYRQITQRIYNGVRLSIATRRREDVRASFGVGATTPLVVSVGRLSPQKNHTALLDAMLALPLARAVIVGDGELRSELEEKIRTLGIADRVTLAGERPANEVTELLSAADVFAFPSLYEAMPMALVEAMLARIPIVASDIPACRELLTAGDGQLLGRLVSHDSPERLGEALSDVVAKPDTATLEAARLRAMSFSVDAMTDNYLAALR